MPSNRIISTALLLPLLVCVMLLGPSASRTPKPRAYSGWFAPEPDQVNEAARHGLPPAVENSLGMRFVIVPSGTFEMGPDFATPHSAAHAVQLTRLVYVQSTEVTVGAFRAFRPSWCSSCGSASAQDPVSCISWEDAWAFARWLSDREDERRYRLLTEAEWEYACRAPSAQCEREGVRNSGERMHNGLSGAAESSARQLRGGRADGASSNSNRWGVHDISGSVTEMCSDWHAAYPRRMVTDPTGPRWGAYRVARGASKTMPGIGPRRRIACDPRICSRQIGFRLALEAPPRRKRPPTHERSTDAPTWSDLSRIQMDMAGRLGWPTAFENDLGMKFVFVPCRPEAGFDPERNIGADLPPQPEGTRRGIYFQISEVTNGQLRAFRPDYDRATHRQAGVPAEISEDDRFPASSVDVGTARAFSKWLTDRDGKWTYRLPSPQEWECACCAGSTFRFWWGESERDAGAFANVRDACQAGIVEESIDFPTRDGHPWQSRVCSYWPNPWGLHDMIGNVREWCIGRSDARCVATLSLPRAGQFDIPRYTLHGGSYESPRDVVGCSRRTSTNADTTLADVGFRLIAAPK